MLHSGELGQDHWQLVVFQACDSRQVQMGHIGARLSESNDVVRDKALVRVGHGEMRQARQWDHVECFLPSKVSTMQLELDECVWVQAEAVLDLCVGQLVSVDERGQVWIHADELNDFDWQSLRIGLDFVHCLADQMVHLTACTP